MLTTILNTLPPSKCVIIQDSLAISGKRLLLSIARNHLNLKNYPVHFFVFENDVNKIKNLLPNEKLTICDCRTDCDNWIDESKLGNFSTSVENRNIQGVVIIDSLAQVIAKYGLAQTYRMLNSLLNQGKNVVQIVAVLHEDMLEEKESTLKYFENFSTLNIKLAPIQNKYPRVYFRHKKPGGKVLKEVEEFYFKGDIFHTQALPKVDAKILLGQTSLEKRPEDMSTFKISLDENEKKTREQLILPYLKNANSDQEEGQGKIIYNLDDIDDWDEEDPDDDLDI